MAVRYYVQVADEVMETRQIPWPEGLRHVQQASEGELPRSHWHLFEDDNAPEELDGRRVVLTLARRGRETGTIVIVKREVLA
jgi:hypothetical protein